MFILAHTGLTLAAARGVDRFRYSRGAKRLSELIDYRLVLVGAMLPDIIDKPLGGIIFRRQLMGNGRTFAHTLLFLIVLSALGIFLWRRYHKPGGLVLAGGTLVHLLLDSMWQFPVILFWPLLGRSFPPDNPDLWFSNWWVELFHDSLTFLPEIAGGIILIGFIVYLTRKHGWADFIRQGRIS